MSFETYGWESSSLAADRRRPNARWGLVSALTFVTVNSQVHNSQLPTAKLRTPNSELLASSFIGLRRNPGNVESTIG